MKVIVSHDIDHITVWEHTKDLIIPKFLVRSKIELLTGKISFSEFSNRLGDFFKNKWQGIDELMVFNKSNNVRASFFIGVNSGVGLCYSLENAAIWTKKIVDEGFEIGVHGIDYDSFEKVEKEYKTFKQISGLDNFGMRMHYLRHNDHTLDYIKKSGYLFDATTSGFQDPYKIGNFYEFPLQIMDGWVINDNGAWQKRNLQQSIDYTKRQIDEAMKKDLKYLSVLFHDRYFTDSFKTWKDWYIWMIEWFVANKLEFVNHQDVIKELESGK